MYGMSLERYSRGIFAQVLSAPSAFEQADALLHEICMGTCSVYTDVVIDMTGLSN